jgi:murein DD-endopeptidase MepM/ murein hydrolase activator NlpD
VDFAAPNGTPVRAAAAGRVTSAHYSTTAGNMIVIDHGGGFDTRYFHLSRFAVGVGARVSQGQTIGYVGSTGNSTGNHLHFETRASGVALDPMYVLQSGAQMDVTARPGNSGGMTSDEVLLIALLAVLVAVAVVRR